MELVFATNNEHKLREIQLLLGCSLKLLSLKDIDCNEEIPETGTTLEANARQKSEYVFNKFGLNCFADDTGLEIDALNGEPGVYSARYAGTDKDAEANMNKVLDLMSEENHRKARFRTVISLIIDGKEHQFEGVVEGEILRERSGKEGFGYDPIFTPDGYQQSFAEMAMELKNEISHRGRAIKKLIDFLKEHYG
ncbi:non-canonical purine NTP diphosphatase [Carboxylicivirga mesophila]|uniref:dITP/XTP pyrophosphatase n=1 Tax=Carboxylicivirga mesophila TaxID=1166478 RepID=A0ABS5KDF8_9BACT|nr:non-canonical purine NTP diphosphatase [Carboxylicivirga mesophila]MBS2213066.1 non-canonical purine NTP diphosphatase [Carboxylicivirga mesophila]